MNINTFANNYLISIDFKVFTIQLSKIKSVDIRQL